MAARLCEAACEGRVELLEEIVGDEGELILNKFVTRVCEGWPLHVAASMGHTQFVEQLLHHQRKLALVLDSDYRSALHLASAEGHVGIVQVLIVVAPEMCVTRDREGRNPLHVAAMKGKDDVLRLLVGVDRYAAKERVEGGDNDTILHLCVKFNKLTTLQLLLHLIKDDDFVNAKDKNGNTILHVAASRENREIVKHLLGTTRVDVDATNGSGRTALGIVTMLSQSRATETQAIDATTRSWLNLIAVSLGGRSFPDNPSVEDMLQLATGGIPIMEDNWVWEKRDFLLVVASLIAAAALQAGMNPPGGVWQDNSNEHGAGEAVMAYNHPKLYSWFINLNGLGYAFSIAAMLLILTGSPTDSVLGKRLVIFLVAMSIMLSACTLSISINSMTSNHKKFPAVFSTIIILYLIITYTIVSFLPISAVFKKVKKIRRSMAASNFSS